MFSPTAQNRARAEFLAFGSLSAAQAAWDANKPEMAAASLEKVPPDYRKAVYNVQQKNLDGFKEGLTGKLEAARKLAIQDDFLGANNLLLDVKKHETWVAELREGRAAIRRQGEAFYARKMVEANLARDYRDAGQWLYKLLTLQEQKTDGIDFDNIFKGGTTAEFLGSLAKVGLHPTRPQDRKNFTDVLLVVANLDNLTDQEEAHKFLKDAYLDWASSQTEAGKFERACYLALLAQKHGSSGAGELFDKAHAELMKQYTVAISSAPPKSTPRLAGTDMPDSLYGEATVAVRKTLPSWMRYEDPENPLDGPAPRFKIKLQAGLKEMASTYEPRIRQVARDFPVESIVENPAYHEAVEAAQEAREAYQREIDSYNSLVQQANNSVSTISAGPNPYGFGALAANVDRIANTAILDREKRDVENAKSQFERAQSKVSQTPRQKKDRQQQTFTWEETDHITHFKAAFSVGLGVEDRVFWTRTIESQVDHKCFSRRANDRLGLPAVERQQPELDKIQSALANDMKPAIRTLCSSSDFLRQVKAALIKHVSEPGQASDPEAQQDAVLGAELIWWDTPLRDFKALADTAYLGKFGDVIAVP